MRIKAAAIAWVAIALAGCHKRDTLVPVDLPGADDYFAKNGYTELVPPVRLPTDAEGRARIRVWLKLPKRGSIDLDAAGRLRMPDETVVERAESIDDRVVDVRGTRFDDGGKEWRHVYRRAGDRLVGVEWPRDDGGAEKRARARIDELVQGSEPDGGAHDQMIARWHALEDCSQCHKKDRDEATVVGALPNRATDGSGLFVPTTVLADAAPLERHRPRDLNLDDHFIRITCARGAAMIAADKEGGRQPRCTDGGVPRATLDVAGALAVGDKHAKEMCASRRWLASRLTDKARARFKDAIAECPEK
jgi:hypothetical protein